MRGRQGSQSAPVVSACRAVQRRHLRGEMESHHNVDIRHGVGSVPVSLIKGSRENRWDKVKNTPWKTMGRERKVGHDKLLTRQHCLNPPLGTNFFRKAPADDAEF